MNEYLRTLNSRIHEQEKKMLIESKPSEQARFKYAIAVLQNARAEYEIFLQEQPKREYETADMLDQIEAEIRAIAPIDGGDFSAGLSFGKGYSVGIIHRFKAKFKK